MEAGGYGVNWGELGKAGSSRGELRVAASGWASQSKVLTRAQLEMSLG